MTSVVIKSVNGIVAQWVGNLYCGSAERVRRWHCSVVYPRAVWCLLGENNGSRELAVYSIIWTRVGVGGRRTRGKNRQRKDASRDGCGWIRTVCRFIDNCVRSAIWHADGCWEVSARCGKVPDIRALEVGFLYKRCVVENDAHVPRGAGIRIGHGLGSGGSGKDRVTCRVLNTARRACYLVSVGVCYCDDRSRLMLGLIKRIHVTRRIRDAGR